MSGEFTKTRRVVTLRLVLCVLISAGAYACENTEPVSYIGSCERLVADSARGGDQPVDVTCDLKKKLWVLALPGKKVTTESLLALGIPEDAALMLAKREFVRPEWCTVDELAGEPRPDDFPGPPFRRFERRCINTILVIPMVAVVRSDKVVITAQRSDEGTVKLVRLSASPP
jgi:hypothetical protein